MQQLQELSLVENGRIGDVAVTRRGALGVGFLVGVGGTLLAACGGNEPTPGPSTGVSSPEKPTVASSPEVDKAPDLFAQAAETLLAMGEEVDGGLRFQSQLQAPDFNTDRDVGAASVGMGFLVMAERYPDDPKWVQAAEKTATWLTAVAQHDKHGTYWPDYANDGGDMADTQYTSFDDGAIGIGDFMWRLYEKTGKDEYKKTALAAVQWTLAHAEKTSNGGYRWRYDLNNPDEGYKMGMGEGLVGIVHGLTTFYERTKESDPALAQQYRKYIAGALRELDVVRAELGRNDGDRRAVPETGVIGQDGDTAMNSGYLSGAAGGAFMYLKLYEAFGDRNYLQKADEIFGWLDDSTNGPKVDMGDGSATWKLMLDPQGGDDESLATGFEEGAAGIGWTYLQAYRVTGNNKYLKPAKQAAQWLTNVAEKDDATGAYSWYEDQDDPSSPVHPNLNNGAAGIGTFFYDLYLVTKDPEHLRVAQGALKHIETTAVRDGDKVYWNDQEKDGGSFSADPSWHWGSAGIIAFAARAHGTSIDIPGEESALRSSRG